jgi:hypothetical protein
MADDGLRRGLRRPFQSWLPPSRQATRQGFETCIQVEHHEGKLA